MLANQSFLDNSLLIQYIGAMRKEIIVALIAGSFLGLVIGFGVWRANSALKSTSSQTSEISDASPEPKAKFDLTIAKPNDLNVIGNNPTTVSGITSSQSWLVVSDEEGDNLVKTETNGTFTKDLTLSGGVNQLLLTALKPTGESVSKSLNLIFSSEFAKPEETPQPSASPSAETESEIRQKVQEKVNEALKNPKAYLGVVTDISPNTIQIKNPQGEIQQISTDKEVTVAKSGKSGVKLTDIAIGDFIVAMGYKNGNEILETTRILITPPSTPLNLSVLMGTVAKVDKKTLTLTKPNSETLEVTPTKDVLIVLYKDGKKTKIKLTDIKENDLTIIVGKNENNVFTARTIVVIRETS